MQQRLNLVNNGQELQQSDINTLGQVASSQDDQVLAELLRIARGNGSTYSKYIAPYSENGVYGTPTVTGGGSGNSSVQVAPFRAIVGSRTAPATNGPLAWSDIRSAIFVGNGTGGAAALTQLLALAANTSGNPRFDLVYAAVQVDAPSANVTRYVKNPTTKVVAPTAVSVYLNTTVSIGAVTGTPAGSPTVPALPADTGTTFYIPLAAVRCVSGFTTINNLDCRDVAPVLPIDTHTGAMTILPANGNNDGAATYATNFPWSTTANTRPAMWLPPSFSGGVTRIAQIDMTSATTSAWSHPPNSIVDSSIDWRRRFFRVTWDLGAGGKFATDTSAPAISIPYANDRASRGNMFLANSFTPSGQLVAGNADALILQQADYSSVIATGAVFGLYVSAANGNLLLGSNGTSPQVKAFMWIEASSQYPGP